MPELPEVETVRLQLLFKIKGKTIAKAKVLHPKTTAHDSAFSRRVKGKTLANIDRIGKLLIFSFSNADFYLLAHLKMTGQFFYVDKSGVSGGGHSMTEADTKLPNKHTRVFFEFTDGSHLYFNDMRLFGYLKIATAAEMEQARAHFGPEPIAADFDIAAFRAGLKRRQTSIKAVLLDQTFVAGLGNIYVDEALFRAKVRPTRRAASLTQKEAELLARASGEVMKHSISVGGTTFQHFKDTGGENGNYTDYLQVFGKQKTPCITCGTDIKKIRVAGRGTHYCPQCQK